MFAADKRYLSISINENVVKVAQVKSSGLVEKIARGQADSSTIDDVAKTLKNILNGFNRKLPVLCVIPANAATAKNLEVPSTSPEEIKSIINLQVGRHTPYSREEVLISYLNLGPGAANNTRILLIIVHRNVVKDRTNVMEKCGLNVDKILYIPEGIGRFYSKALNLKKDSPALGVVDVSLNVTNYLIVHKGNLIFARPIPIGIKAIMEQSDVSAKLSEEFKKSIDAFVQEDMSTPPESYILTTNHEAVLNVVPALSQSLNIQLQSSPFTHFIKGAGSIKKRLEKDFGDDSFLDVIAPAIMAGKSDVNLMPDEMILKKTVERQSREATLTGICAVVLMLLIGALVMTKVYFKETFLNKNLKEHYAPEHEEVTKLEDRMAKNKIVIDYLKKRDVSLDVIHELYSITPNQIYLNNITLDDDGTISIDGVSESMSQVFSYVKSLNDSTMFKDVKTKSTATKKEAGKDVAAFQLVMKLKDA